MSDLLRPAIVVLFLSATSLVHAGNEPADQNLWDITNNQCGDRQEATVPNMDAFTNSCWEYLNTVGCDYQGPTNPTLYIKTVDGPVRNPANGRWYYTQNLHCTDSTDKFRIAIKWNRLACQDADVLGNDDDGEYGEAGAYGICAERPEADRREELTNAMCTPKPGNPCDAASGDKIIQETDFEGVGLHFYRTWHSMAPKMSSLVGSRWVHSYGDYLDLDSQGVPLAVITPDGYYMTLSSTTGGTYIAPARPGIRLKQVGSDYSVEYPGGEIRVYDVDGRLSTVESQPGQLTTLTYDVTSGNLTDIVGPFGHELRLTYHSSTGRIQYLYWPDNKKVIYAHRYSNGNQRLWAVNYPRGRVKVYYAEDSTYKDFITGIRDENGKRLATYGYELATGKVAWSEHAGGAGRVDLTYNTNSTIVTDGDGRTKTYDFAASPFGGDRLVSTERNGTTASKTYAAPGVDALQRIATSADASGNIEAFSYNDHHRASVTEASATSLARTTAYEYLRPDSNKVTKVKRSSLHSTNDVETTITYNSLDLPLTVTESGYDSAETPITRTTTVTYNSYGQVLTIDGPRTDVSDVTTFTYYNCTTGNACGQLATITNAAGHVTTFNSYDAAGRLTKETDQNGHIREYTYNSLSGLLQKVRRKSPTGDYRDYNYVFYNNETLKRGPLGPYGEDLHFTYDDAQRITEVRDDNYNTIKYQYDSAGNVIDEKIEDSSGTLKRHVQYAFDSWGRLDNINRSGSVTDLLFDALGNLEESQNPNLNITEYVYDELNRLTETIDPTTNSTLTAYDVHDNLVQVTAPNNAVTTYVYDDLGRLESESSPDRGVTTYTYDAAGNMLSRTDARNITATYTYDVLNRVTSIAYPTSSKNVTFGYDNGQYNKGSLTSMTDESGSTTWNHYTPGPGPKERTMTKTQVTGGVTLTTSFTYDSIDGRLKSINYPSGTPLVLAYSDYNVTALDFGGTQVLSGASYDPFGPIMSWTWGNGTSASRIYNLKGEMTSHGLATDTRTLSYDAASQLDTQSDGEYYLEFGYDILGRIDDFDAAPQNGGTLVAGSQVFTYDANGNRTSITEDSNYYLNTVDANSNRLLSMAGPTAKTYAYDASGNVTNDGIHTYVYDDRGRLQSIDSGATTYLYNGSGERVKKNAGSTLTLFVYGTNGELLGEYDAAGNPIQETIWLDGLPVATKQGDTLYYVHADHLGTPRAISNGNTIVWRWDSDPFGSTVADDDPDGDSNTFTYNLRFPGQYFDVETGLHYNYHRTYDPSTGRYLESDPIGLQGGLNTYGYAYQNPLTYTDPLGLNPACIPVAAVDGPIPVADILCLGGTAILAGAYANSSSSDVNSNVTELFPKADSDAENCPPDDFCKRNRARLLRERNFLIDAVDLLKKGPYMNDPETLSAHKNEVLKYNRESKEHNRMCGSKFRVPKIVDRKLFDLILTLRP